MNKPSTAGIDFSSQFKRQLAKAPLKIKIAFYRRLDLFINQPHHPQLHNHSLRGRWDGYRSLNVTGDWRAIFSQKYERGQSKPTILFIALGTHSQLYR